jgi:hypothetical protein
MSTRDTIINTIINDMEESLTTGSDNYEIGAAEIKRGAHLFDDCANKPALCVSVVEDEKTSDTLGPQRLRKLHMDIMAYTEEDGYTQDNINKLIRDIEYFLESTDCTYYQAVTIGSIRIFEGGVSFPRGEARMEITVTYSQSITNP